MRVIVVGLGVQGRKRLAVAGGDVVATVDPANDEASFRGVEDVPVESFDAALLCIPDAAKLPMIDYLVSNRKHVLVEKPLFAADSRDLMRLMNMARSQSVSVYTAYNHRFEPHIVETKGILDSGELGQLYSIRMFYGNGTARLVRNSPWRDTGAGVVADLGSHLLDTIEFWMGPGGDSFNLFGVNCFETNSPDHVLFGRPGRPFIQLEATLLSWRNEFHCEVLAENGSLHIDGLCKWGPSTLKVRKRILPSGQPTERALTLLQPDPTWRAEYEYFKALCVERRSHIARDIWINDKLSNLVGQLPVGAVGRKVSS